MGMVSFKHRGNFNHTKKFLSTMKNRTYFSMVLDKYGKEGVQALSAATPSDSGLTAQSWNYRIERNRDSIIISWYNTNEVDGVNIAVILQYGHGTGTGGYVQGRDYINPAMQPIFDKLAEEAWKEVASS